MQRLKKILRELHPELELSGEERLIEDGILDSLDIVTLVTDINSEYGIRIGAEDIIKENFDSCDDIIALVARLGGKIECS